VAPARPVSGPAPYSSHPGRTGSLLTATRIANSGDMTGAVKRASMATRPRVLRLTCAAGRRAAKASPSSLTTRCARYTRTGRPSSRSPDYTVPLLPCGRQTACLQRSSSQSGTRGRQRRAVDDELKSIAPQTPVQTANSPAGPDQWSGVVARWRVHRLRPGSQRSSARDLSHGRRRTPLAPPDAGPHAHSVATRPVSLLGRTVEIEWERRSQAALQTSIVHAGV
jgi:hypothetical protein